MIFVTVGSQKFQFDRLLKEIDRLIDEGIIKEEVFAQTGCSNYIPKNFAYKNFINREEFKKILDKSEIVITHGGTGVIVNSIKLRKRVIAVPRLAKYGEHVDNHQLQIISQFNEKNFICGLNDCEELGKSIKEIRNMQFDEYVSNTYRYIDDIEKYIDEI